MVITSDSKYYWLKLQNDFFKRHDIRIVESMPNGKDYVIFYLKLLCESTSHEGALRFNDEIPYSDEMLATITNTNVDIVRSAVKVFEQLKMIEVLDDGTLYMKQVERMVGSETKWADYKRVSRKKAKQIGHCPTQIGNCPIEIDIDIDKELDIDKDIKKDNKKTKHKYGEYNHVLLTDEEYKKLSQDYPNVEELITYLDEYIEMKGYKAKSHYLAIKKWVVDAVSRNKPKETEKLETYDNSKNCKITDEELQAFKDLRGEHD